MLLPLACALVYLLLSVRVRVNAGISLNDAQSAVFLSLGAYGLDLRFDGTLERGEDGLRLRLCPRYGGQAPRLLRVHRPSGSQKRNLRLARAALRALHWGQISVQLRVGTHEAWQTALIAGALRSFASAALAAIGQAPPCDIRIDADFHAPCFLLAARCIFFAAPGDIMIAVAREAAKKTQREGFKWLSIPLRA